jgi:predicted transcriptional regulator
MEHGFLAGRRDWEDRSALGFAAPFKGRAIERTVNVEEARIRVFAVSRHAEGMEHSCLAGRRDRDDGSIVVCAPTIRRAVERIVDVDEARIRVFAVSKISKSDTLLVSGMLERRLFHRLVDLEYPTAEPLVEDRE